MGCRSCRRSGSYLRANLLREAVEILEKGEKMKKPSIEKKIRMDGSENVKGKCYFCGKEVNGEFYCFGCGEFICDECECDDPPFGRHSIEDHKK